MYIQFTSNFPFHFLEPSYQNPPGTLYYPSNSQDSRQSIVYPAYAPNLNIPMISPYHPEMPQQQAQPQQMSVEQVTLLNRTRLSKSLIESNKSILSGATIRSVTFSDRATVITGIKSAAVLTVWEYVP